MLSIRCILEYFFLYKVAVDPVQKLWSLYLIFSSCKKYHLVLEVLKVFFKNILLATT